MNTETTRFLIPFRSNTRVGIAFMFIAILALAAALIIAGGIAIAAGLQSRSRAEFVRKNLLRASNIVAVTSDDKANPGKIGIYLNGKLAGAIVENGSFTATDTPRSEGPITLSFANPLNTPEPANVRFSAQNVRITTDRGETVLCVPAINAGRVIWADLKGNTYYDSTLRLIARSCTR